MIELLNVNKYYNRGKKNQLHVINNTSLKFDDKGMVAILGNSGCGKTTLLNVIGGLDKPNSGKIFVNGKRMNRLSSSITDSIRNLNIGYIFQNYQLIDDMSVFDNVALVLKMLGIKNKAQIKESVNYVLEVVGLYRYRNRPAGMLSGGERQRVGIARAIVKNPNIIIADEPTGNLDSKNSLEIMNIIKAISADKLVILVTHEKDLAHFYADRIIEVVDGKVTSDYQNDHNDELDYRVDNKIYLKDLPVRKKLLSPALNVEYYSDDESQLNIKVVVKNKKIYIECPENKVDVVDENSSMELVNDNYKKISKDTYEAYKFDYEKITPKNKKLRYHSIFNPFTLLFSGFKKVFNYPVLKKLLLAGFVASSMFVMYAISNAVGITTVTDDEFIRYNKNYVILKTNNNTVEDYYSYQNMEGVGYIMPGDSLINFNIDYSGYYYQTNNAQDYVNASLASSELLSDADLIGGKLPESSSETVLDAMLLRSLCSEGTAAQLGIKNVNDFVGKTIKIGENKKLTIVGIVDLMSPSFYTVNDAFFPILKAAGIDTYYDENVSYNNSANVEDFNTSWDKFTLTEGNYPYNDYEVIINEAYKDTYSLYSYIPQRINGHELQVVGYYKSYSGANGYYTNANMLTYKFLACTKDITIYPTDKAAVMSYFEQNNLNAQDAYETSRKEYMESIKQSVKSTLIIAAIIMLISLVEIFLMLRSSFLSRVKEVGTLRAIGLKKSDMYKMFLGEILAITLTTSTLGFAVMGYILNGLSKISYFGNMYTFDLKVVLASVIIVYAFNILVGLLPVFATLRKTPAQILSRTDVD